MLKSTDPQEAINSINRALVIGKELLTDKERYRYRHSLGALLIKVKKYDKAMEIFEDLEKAPEGVFSKSAQASIRKLGNIVKERFVGSFFK